MIISLHLPKTAGYSFRMALENYFGKAFLPDYEDVPISKPQYQRSNEALLASAAIAEVGLPGIQCVHGHFLPVKYLLLSIKQEMKFITWMRDPVERILSHYFFWQRSYEPETALPHQRRVLEEGWSLEQFCLSSEFQNLYAQYLWGFPLENFDFIGITEHYAFDLKYFSEKFLTVNLPLYKENVGDRTGKKYKIDKKFRKKIEQHHAADIELYQRALQIRRKRK